MRKRRKTVEEESALDLVERAFLLLRSAPLHVWAVYCFGTLPFLLGLLFFLSDMASSPFAAGRSVGLSLGLGVLFVWMRIWQSVFCRRLSALLLNRPVPPVSVKGLMRQIGLHVAYSSWGLFLVPASVLMMLPLGWVVAYFNSLCVVDLSGCSSRDGAAKVRAMAMVWPKQNHVALSLLSAFGLIVFFNVAIVLIQIPSLLKSLAGIDSEFTRSYYWMGDTLFISAVCALTYFVVDPLVKAVYVLRFHAAESIKTGTDLISELNEIPIKRRVAGALVILFLLVPSFCPTASAQELEPVPPPVGTLVQSDALDASVDRVMVRSEFTWRMPRDLVADPMEEKGFFSRFFESVGHWMKDGIRAVFDGLETFFDWIGDHFDFSPKNKRDRGEFNPDVFKGLSVILLVVLVGVLAWYVVKAWRIRRRPIVEPDAIVPIAVDLEDESLVATMLEEDDWVKLARQLTEAKEYRTAMRAWFLAGLAALAQADLVAVFPSKSNLDYRRELSRRARRLPAVLPLFGDNIRAFERVWYGRYTGSLDDVLLMEQNTERMRHDIQA